jgi:hypothetical protein
MIRLAARGRKPEAGSPFLSSHRERTPGFFALRHDLGFQRGRRRHGRLGQSDALADALLHSQRGGAFIARRDVRDDLGSLGRIERAQRQGRQAAADLVVCHGSALRNVPIALRKRVFTVPSGMPVRSAISVWVRPS